MNNIKVNLITHTIFLSLIVLTHLIFNVASAEKPLNWQTVATLIDEQKFNEATDKIDLLLKKFKIVKNDKHWRQTLVLGTTLRSITSPPEEAVNFLTSQSWPRDNDSKLLLNMHLVKALTDYISVNTWEINRREKIKTNKLLTLKTKTMGQLKADINLAFKSAYQLAQSRQNDSLDSLWLEGFRGKNNYFNDSNYPKNVRGGVLDTISYLWIDFLSNTRYWEVLEDQKAHKIPLTDLLSNSNLVAPSNSNIHPLLRAMSLVNRIEKNAIKNKQPEVALEAFRIKIKTISYHRSAKDHNQLRELLKSRIENENPNHSWINMLRHDLARMVRNTNTPDANIKSIAILKECLSIHNTQKVTRSCNDLSQEIQKPNLDLSSMRVDGLNKRSILINHANIDKLYFKAWKLSKEEAIQKNHHQFIESLIKSKRKATSEWQTKLHPTKDYRSHKTYLTPPVNQHGFWLIAASLDPDFSLTKNRNLIASTSINITRFIADSNSTSDTLSIKLHNGESGQLASNINLELWGGDYNKPKTLLSKTISSKNGMAKFSISNNKSYTILAEKAKDFMLLSNVNASYMGTPETKVSNSLLFTDRSIYRPGQKINWKVIAYQGNSETGKYKVSPQSKGVITLKDANGKEVQKIDVTTNQYGSASGEFIAKTGLLLGQWRIDSSFSGSKSIRVEEYKRPTFKAEFKKTKDSLRLNQKAEITGSVNYYFGQAATDGKVKWRVQRQGFYPWRHGYNGAEVKPLVIASNEVSLDEKGEFKIIFMPKEYNFSNRSTSDKNKEIPHQYIITADITNSGGETRSISKTLNISKTSIRASIQANQTYGLANREITFDISREDLDGTPRTGSALWSLHRVQQPSKTHLPFEVPNTILKQNIPYSTVGDKLKPRWTTAQSNTQLVSNWKDSNVIQKGPLRHDKDGATNLKIKITQAGIYRLHYTTKDKAGNVFKTQKDIIIAANKNTPIMLPAVLETQSTSVTPGSKVKLLLGTGFKETPYTLDIYHGIELIKRQAFKSGINQYEFPVSQQHQGGLSFVLTTIKDYQLFRKQLSISVPWSDRNLNVSFSSFRDKLKPGQKETWRISVKDAKNLPLEKGTVEILASMYDRSLDLFGKHYPANIRSLYQTKSSYLDRNNNLGRRGNLFSKQYIVKDTFPKLQTASLNNLYFLNFDNRSSFVHSHPAIPRCTKSARHNHRFEKRDHQHKYSCQGMRPALRRATAPVAAPAAAPAPRMQPKPMMAPRRVAKPPAPQVDVRALQMKLKASGYYNGPINGTVNTKTRAALQRFMKREDNEAINIDKKESNSNNLEDVKTRTNFNETAFFYPHLVLEENGSVAFEFEVPESLTEWNVWVSAITKDLRGGDLSEYAKTSKELIVRPYLPRFLRSGDKAKIEVLINNTGEKPLTGNLDFDVLDPATNESLSSNFKLANNKRGFTVAAGQSSRLSFSLDAPKDLGLVAIRARAKASNGKDQFGDGEQRPLPVLPSKLYLNQSRFAAVKGNTTKELNFEDLPKSNDATRENESLTVNIEGQLFYSTLNALPYLVDYPYECTEQTLNRFLSTSMISSVFKKHPAIASIAQGMTDRKGILAKWNDVDNDPNRKMLLEETPWLNNANSTNIKEGLQKILDPKIVELQYQKALKKLTKAQNESGAFPWWEGGRDSTYMTAYLLQGFSRAIEFNVNVPKVMVQKAWAFLDSIYKKDFSNKINYHLTETVLINYVISSYPDNSWMGKAFNQNLRDKILNHSFKKWKSLPPLSKAYLALTLKRVGRTNQATLVFDSIMDSAKTSEELGTYWSPRQHSWFWYNDNIDTHAFMLKALMEIDPSDSRRHGLVQWLMMNKKLNHWKSTRATAESIYSLVQYLDKEKQLGIDETIQIDIGNSYSNNIVFKANEYPSTKNTTVIKGDDISADMANIKINNKSKSLIFASANWHFSTEVLPKNAQGDFFKVTRTFFKRIQKGNNWELQPLKEGAIVKVGDQLEVQLKLYAKNNAEFIHLRAPRGAGFEPETQDSGYRWNRNIGYYEEIRDSGTNYFFDELRRGEYNFKYRLRATTAGDFRMAPATVQSVYAPEFNAYSSGQRMIIK